MATGWRRLRPAARAASEHELDRELRGYFDTLVERHRAHGADEQAAIRAARLEMGGMQQVKEATRDAWTTTTWERMAEDARYAWRALRKSPLLAVSVALTFGLGIGGVTAIFSIVNAMLLTPMPYRDPARLVFVRADLAEAAYPRAPLSGPELNDLRERTRLFEGFGAVWSNSTTLTDGNEPEQLRLGLVSTNLFPLLGVPAALGRTFEPRDEIQGGPQRTILLSWALWQRRYGGDRQMVGRTVQVNEQPATVVGVLPENFRMLLPPGSGVPDDLDAYQLFNPAFVRGPRGQQFLRVVGRMRPGVTVSQAREEITRIATGISREFPEYAPFGRRFDTVSLPDENVREVRGPLLILLAGVGLLLVIAAVNAASLLVARAAHKRAETALRLALGAGIARIVRASLAEGLIVATAGAAIGLAFGKAALTLLATARPDALDRLREAPLDGRVMAAAAALAFAWGILFGMAPLTEFFRTNIVGAIGTRGDPDRVRAGTRSALVILQVALSLVLLVAAGLMIRTFRNVQAIDPGFRSDGVLTFRMASSSPRYRTREATNALARRIEQVVAAVPGVTAVASVSHLPYDNIPNWFGPYSTDEAASGSPSHADYRAVSPGFFDTVGVQQLEGRRFTEADDFGRQLVAIVDDQLAHRTWPNGSAVGQRLWTDPNSTGKPAVQVTVIGVVRHVRYRSLIEPLNEQVYFPLRQVFRNPVAYVVKTDAAVPESTTAVRQAIASVDARMPMYDIRPMTEYVARARAVQRFSMIVVAVFAALAVVLASIGIYGVIAFVVLRRRREFGVRLALGARPGQIVGLVLRDGLRLAITGVAVGVAFAILAGRFVQAQLFAVAWYDPMTYGVVLPLLIVMALAACWWPARDAIASNPLEALRAE